MSSGPVFSGDREAPERVAFGACTTGFTSGSLDRGFFRAVLKVDAMRGATLGVLPHDQDVELDLSQVTNDRGREWELTFKLWGLEERSFTSVYCAGRVREGRAFQGWRLCGAVVTMELDLHHRTLTFRREGRTDIVLHDVPSRVVPFVKVSGGDPPNAVTIVESSYDEGLDKLTLTVHADRSPAAGFFSVAATTMGGDEACALDLAGGTTEKELFAAIEREIERAQFHLFLADGRRLAVNGSACLEELCGQGGAGAGPGPEDGLPRISANLHGKKDKSD